MNAIGKCGKEGLQGIAFNSFHGHAVAVEIRVARRVQRNMESKTPNHAGTSGFKTDPMRVESAAFESYSVRADKRLQLLKDCSTNIQATVSV
jgi:hypothetical protein